ncbi:PQQ-binding-like beta-propeller repeat protein [Haloferula rosea]|uniref:PQQ-binding-like beta-propeller repeat protein n=1 Tax=Haloferula rosea TaxID=490093 RepID=A0A934RFM9_9BACT|nr:PQQ-binding-like beta-propeller repeat protein [Haloferula rosea]MBK1827505.1 PQQ-binding-like beta-propeller repeat protein [Haloferula rosea]
MRENVSASLCFASILSLTAVHADDWPSWRGPTANGVGKADVPSDLSLSENLLWKVKLPGRGCSTPVVVDGRIFVTSPIGKEDGVLAFDSAGKELWRKTLGTLRPGRGQRVGSSANSSPVTDGKTLFTYFKSGELGAFDFEGKELWNLNVFDKYGEDKLWWDVGTSPVVTSKGLVLAVMQTDGKSFLLCLDKRTGKELWKVDRKFETGVESGDAYTTPHVVDVDGRETIVVWGADHLTGHSVETGEQLWVCGGFNPKKLKAWRVIASPVITDGVAVVPFGRGEFTAGVKLGGTGDITESASLWRSTKCGSDSATPVARDGLAYILNDSGKDRGKVTCVEAGTGEIKWQSKLPRGAQIYYSSPVISGDTFLAAREDGTVFSAKIGSAGLENVQEHEIGEDLIASPVVVDDMILLRGGAHLMAFGRK